MQIKHFKKTLIMNNKWTRTCKALKGLLAILSCSKCKKSLHDPQQFLMCGHFSCISCINNNNTTCIQCELPCKRENIIKDDTIERIVQACCKIAQEVDFKQNIESREKTAKEIPVEQLENNSHVFTNNLNSGLNNSIPKSNKLSKKLLKISKKRKRAAMFNNNENAKKVKCNTPVPILRIPKNINKRNHVGETKLQEECKKNHKENVKLLLEEGANPNISCNAGWTPLQESVDFDYYEITKMLLKKGADVNQSGFEGRTALHEAAINNNSRMIMLLLKYNARKDLLDKEGKRPIDLCNLNEVKKLLNSDAKINMECENTEVQQNVDTSNIITNNSCNKSERTRHKNYSYENKEKQSSNVESRVKIENDADDEIQVLFANVNSNNITNNYLQETGCNRISQKSIDGNNVDNIDRVTVGYSTSQRSIDCEGTKDELGNAINNIKLSQESIDVVNTCDSTKIDFNGGFSLSTKNINHESNIHKSSQNKSNIVNGSLILTDSEEIIDIIN